ncbi:hypothetical protein TRIUR3_21064 [Triticum urartu]|uniref:Uncharacterized protein n=1 Tax=Triticum urartu TaxID=4572 RepID=M7YFF3_TRIUA|nr:hypothetical protein TRIUR3_21064 [Triticum urartu]
MGVEDDANSFALGTIHQVENDGNSYPTPTRTSSLLFCGSRYDPECDPNLQPVIGMQFDTWEEGTEWSRAKEEGNGYWQDCFAQLNNFARSIV